MRSRLFTTAVGFALGATLAGGIAVATTSAAGSVKACRSSSGVLELASKHGACPRGGKKLTLNVRGVTGSRGPRGLQGVPGPGASASLAASSSPDEESDGAKIAIAGTGLTVQAQCAGNLFSSMSIAGAGDYQVHGGATLTGSGNDVSATDHASNDTTEQTDLDTGANNINYDNASTNAALSSSIGMAPLTTTAGFTTLSGEVIVVKQGSAFQITLFEFLTSSACNATVEVTPTG